MTLPRANRWLALWYGSAMATLFFYPLMQALGGDIYFLIWQRPHTVEFGLAFAGLTLAAALAWSAIERIPSERVQLAGLLLLAAIPVASFAAALLRQLPLKETLIPLAARGDVRLGVLVTVALASAATFAARPRQALAVARGTLRLMSPVVVITLLTFVRLARYEGGQAEFSHPSKQLTGSASPSVFVFVFDELSYHFVYRGGVVRADLPNLSQFAAQATNYASARAPGAETITSVPGLLGGRTFIDVDVRGDELQEVLADGRRRPLDLASPGSLFASARVAGLRTEVVGYYLPYCRMLSQLVDTCRSFSFYNYASVSGGFSPVNPVMTTLVLWPYQQPFGLLKVPAFSRLQRGIVDATVQAAVADLDPSTPRFRFVHLSVPHLPFVFDRTGFNPGADPMRKDESNYERQLQYTDVLVGTLLEALVKAGVYAGSTVVLTSDHEYRWASLAESEARHVPLLVKRPRQVLREDVSDPVASELVLSRLVGHRPGSATPRQPPGTPSGAGDRATGLLSGVDKALQ